MDRRSGRVQSQSALSCKEQEKVSWIFQSFPRKRKEKESLPARNQARDEKEKAKTHDDGPHQKQPHINHRQRHLPPRLLVPPPIQKEPKDPTEPVREPARKQRRDETEEVIEDGDRFRDDPSDGPEDQDDERPDAEAGPGAFAHAVGAAVEADVDVFGRDVAVDDACFILR